jgi:hypothetical protein
VIDEKKDLFSSDESVNFKGKRNLVGVPKHLEDTEFKRKLSEERKK